MNKKSIWFLFMLVLWSGWFFKAKADQTAPCRTYLNNGGYYFDDFEKADYANGFLQIHLKLRPVHNDGRSWLGEFFMHNADCSTKVYPQPGGVIIENFRPGMQLFSVRFSSLTHYDLWDDEQDLKIECQNCTGDLPAGDYPTISFEGQLDAGGSLFHSSSFSIAEVQTKQINPVLIVPGIMGTELDLNEETLWLNQLKVISDRSDSFLDPLNINALGQPAEPNIIVGPVLGNINYAFGKYHYSDLLVDEFEKNGYVRENNLFLFNYDWRQDVKQTANKLRDRIAQILQSTGATKIDLVAHSLGGLVTKQYLVDSGADSKIGKVVFVGVPNLGAPQAAKALIFGDSFNIPLLSSDEVQKIIQNMPSVYELLPTAEYFKRNTGFFADLSKNQNILNYDSSKTFLLGLGKNRDLLNQAEALHVGQLDNLDFSVSGVQAFNIVGCGVFTTQTINKYYSGDPGLLKNLYNPKYRITSVSGDGTVPLASAAYLNVPAPNVFYSKDIQHAQMLSADGNRQLIAALITGSGLALPQNISQDKNNCGVQGKLVSLPSSLELTVTDPVTHAALNETNGVIRNKVGNDVLVFVPADKKYEIAAKPSKEIGPVNISVENITNNKTTYYDNIKINQEFILDIQPDSQQAENLNDLGAPEIVPPTYTDSGDSVDTMPPVTRLSSYSGKFYQNGELFNISMQERRISFSATDEGSGVSALNYSFDKGNTWAVFDSGYVLVPTDTESVLFFAIDKAGNVEQPSEVQLQWDYNQSQPPIIIQAPPPAQSLPEEPVQTADQETEQTADPLVDTLDVPASEAPATYESNPLPVTNDYNRQIIVPVETGQHSALPPINLTINIPNANLPVQTDQRADLVFMGVYKIISVLWHLIFF